MVMNLQLSKNCHEWVEIVARMGVVKSTLTSAQGKHLVKGWTVCLSVLRDAYVREGSGQNKCILFLKFHSTINRQPAAYLKTPRAQQIRCVFTGYAKKFCC